MLIPQESLGFNADVIERPGDDRHGNRPGFGAALIGAVITGLALVAVGAILAFAITGHPSFLNVQVAGWVIMLTGVAGMLVPRRGYGWLRRRVVRRPVRRDVAADGGKQPFPPYVMLNRGAS